MVSSEFQTIIKTVPTGTQDGSKNCNIDQTQNNKRMVITIIETFYYKHDLKRFLNLNEFKTLRVIKLSKNQEIYINSSLFLIEGNIESLHMDNNGEIIKIRDIIPKDILVGISNALGNAVIDLYYKAKVDSILLDIPQHLMNRFLNQIDFCQLLVSLLCNHFRLYMIDSLISKKYSNEEKIKYFLKQELSTDNVIHLKNVSLFLEKYGLNRTTFYRELKKLESAGWLSKNGRFITINE